MEIRIATVSDAEEIRKIYAPYVTNTAVSFEYSVPTEEEFRRRISETLKNYPYLVAIENDSIVGYAYAGPFHAREAYQHCAELSIYIKLQAHGKGIGRKLYHQLEELLKRQNVCLVHACIAVPEKTDEHLSEASVLFHEKMGFEIAGKHKLCGYKFGKWYSIVWMDKVIQDRAHITSAFIPFSQLWMQSDSLSIE